MQKYKKIYILHGWAYSVEKWEPFLEQLNKGGLEAVMLKIPGLTAPLQEVWKLEDYVEWLNKILEKEKGMIILLGHSNGGRISLAYALKYPAKVSQLFLIDSAGIYHNELPIRFKRFVFKCIAKTGKKFGDVLLFRKIMYKLAREHDYEQADPIVRLTMQNLTQADLKPKLIRIKSPTTIIWGERDTVTSLKDGRMINEIIAGSKLFIIKYAKHSPQFTHTEEVVDIICKNLLLSPGFPFSLQRRAGTGMTNLDPGMTKFIMKNKINIDLINIKAAIFDLDGTIVDSMGFHREAFKRFFAKHGVQLTDEEFLKNISGKTNRYIFQYYLSGSFNEDNFHAFVEEKEKIYRELAAGKLKEIAGFKNALNYFINKKVKLGIATNAPEDNRNFVLDALHIKQNFDIILGVEHITQGKPDPEMYLLAAEKLGVEPRECIIFEDSPAGIEAGKRAGAKVVGLMTAHTSEELSKADYLVKDYREIELL